MARHRWLFPGGRLVGNQCVACRTCIGWDYIPSHKPGSMRRYYFLRRLNKPASLAPLNGAWLNALGPREPWPRRKPLPKCVEVK